MGYLTEKEQIAILEKEGYVYNDNYRFAEKEFKNSNGEIITVKVFPNEGRISIFINSELKEIKRFKSKLEEDYFLGVINAKIKNYIQ